MVGGRSLNWLQVYDLGIGEEESVQFQKDLTYTAGVVLGYKLISFNYNVNLSNVFSKQSSSSNQLNFILNTNCIALEMSYIKNTDAVNLVSFRNTDEIQNIDQEFNGIENTALNIDVYYYFNKYKYSNASAYSIGYVNKQVKSAGSFLVGVNYAHQNTSLDIDELKTNLPLKLLENTDELILQYNSLGVSLGYGYNFVFAKNWMTNLSLIPSVGVKFFEKENNLEGDDNIVMGNKARFSVVYNQGKYFGSAGGAYISNLVFSKDYTFTNSTGIFNLTFGVKF